MTGWVIGAIASRGPTGGYRLGTPELIYAYAGAEGYAHATKVADSSTGTLLVSYQIPAVIGGNPDRYGLIEEIQTDGTFVGTVDTYTEPIGYLATDAAGHFYSLDDTGHERIYRDGDGADWADISAFSSDYTSVSGIFVNPTDGSVWFTASDAYIYEVNSSGSGLTQHGPLAGSHIFGGLTWGVDRFYIADLGPGACYSYEPGVGFALIGGDPGSIDIEDVTFSPTSGRLYFSAEAGGANGELSSMLPDGSDGLVEFDESAFGGLGPQSIACIGDYLYVTTLDVHALTTPITADTYVWRIEIIPA